MLTDYLFRIILRTNFKKSLNDYAVGLDNGELVFSMTYEIEGFQMAKPIALRRRITYTRREGL
jgi:hypothetical protein